MLFRTFERQADGIRSVTDQRPVTVEPVVMPDGSRSWTVVRANGVPVEPVDRFLAYLQTLPNGECGRPIQQSCPHPNACLTCDDFLTMGVISAPIATSWSERGSSLPPRRRTGTSGWWR